MEKTVVPDRSLLGENEQVPISEAVVARVPRRNVKEFWLTILREAERPQTQLFEPEGRVLGLQ